MMYSSDQHFDDSENEFRSVLGSLRVLSPFVANYNRISRQRSTPSSESCLSDFHRFRVRNETPAIFTQHAHTKC
jgi:hypothetical protein